MYLQYSTRQEIVHSKQPLDGPSNVLLVTMDNLDVSSHCDDKLTAHVQLFMDISLHCQEQQKLLCACKSCHESFHHLTGQLLQLTHLLLDPSQLQFLALHFSECCRLIVHDSYADLSSPATTLTARLVCSPQSRSPLRCCTWSSAPLASSTS